MSVGIIKYNAGNIFSVRCALQRIGVDAQVTDDKQQLLACDKIIFPGVGEASTAMAHLRATGLDRLIVSLRHRHATALRPFRRRRCRLPWYIRRTHREAI